MSAAPSPASGELESLVEELVQCASSADGSSAGAKTLLRLAASQLAAVAAERDKWRQHCSDAEDMWNQYQDGLYAENGRRHQAEDKLIECHEMICALGARAETAERLLAEARSALEEIADHPIRNQVGGRPDLGIRSWRPCQDIASEALATLSVGGGNG